MDEIFILLIVLVIGFCLSGLAALIISIVALNKTNSLSRQIRAKGLLIDKIPTRTPTEAAKPRPAAATTPPPPPPVMKTIVPSEAKEEKPLQQIIKPPEIQKAAVETRKTITLEQRIGTQWLPIAGIVTVIVGIGFFLKYTYDNNLVGPMGRVVIAAISGLIALFAGEITRKRGYDIVAKAVTGLGFGILYAAVFSAYRFYNLIDTIPAFSLAILITLAAMLYAVSLNEVLIAVLSLIGGFLTPIIISTGENIPAVLFTYVLILGAGAMICAYYRKWRAVNLVAFVGTFALYTNWFEHFYRAAMRSEGVPEQMAVALGWAGVFFAIYLVLPLFNGLIRRAKAQKEDVLLVLANAAITLYYLWTILFSEYRMELSFCAVGMCVAHLIIMTVAAKRCSEDTNLKIILLAAGLFFLTIAFPLYFKMYAVAMAWAIEAVVLTLIGLRYRSIWTRICAAAAILLSLGKLLDELPMHTGAFSPVLNPAFGTWVFVSAAIAVCCVLYRRNSYIKAGSRRIISQILHSLSVLVLMAAVIAEWVWHCDYNIIQKTGDVYFIRGMFVIFTVFTLLFAARPIAPSGRICKVLTVVAAFCGSIFVMLAFTEIYHESFTIFANINFALVVLFVAGLFAAALFLRQTLRDDPGSSIFYAIVALTAVFVFWILLSEQTYLYWYCKNRFAEKVANWSFLANMYISVMWAIYGAILMAVGFWRKNALLRYISLGLFALLLAKVFILDMGTVKSVFRIAAFLATGMTLVGVSYLYQYLKNKGFFEVVPAEKKTQISERDPK